MEVMLVVLSTAIGTIVGVTLGLLMINRRGRVTPTGAHLAALQNEFAGALPADPAPAPAGSPSVNLEDLRKLVVDRDDALRQSYDDLQRVQQECEQAKATAHQESLQRMAAEQRVQELSAQLAELTQQTTEWQTRSKEHEDLGSRIASLTSELSATQQARQAQAETRAKELETLNAQISSLTAELSAAQQSRQAQAETRAKELETLNAQISSLTAELSAAQQSSEQNGSYRSSLEAQLTADRDYIRQLTAQIADLQREASSTETRLLEQRQLAAKGLELLTLAQDHFTGVFRNSYNGAEASVAAAE
jgi:chromosome segregation ATPase